MALDPQSRPATNHVVRLHDALEYLDRGLAIIPIRPGTKEAARSWKSYQKTRPSESDVRSWFGGEDQTALAVIMGDVSGGLICRDFDEMAAYEQWSIDHADLARELPTVATPRPGRHVYARADIGAIRTASRTGGGILTFEDGELRGGGYCLLPPSIHPTGEAYRWLTPLGANLPKIELELSGFIPCNREDGGRLRLPKTLEPCPPSSPLTLSSLLQDQAELAIASTLPTKSGQRHRLIFELARALKAIPALADAPLAELKPYVRRWHGHAVRIIATKPFEESWIDFAEAWGKVKFPKGQEPIRALFDLANAAKPPHVAQQYETPEVRRLVAFCRELQRVNGAAPFFLDCRTAGELLGVKHTTAWRWLRLLQHDQILALVAAGSRAKRKASRYRYLAGLE